MMLFMDGTVRPSTDMEEVLSGIETNVRPPDCEEIPGEQFDDFSDACM